MRVLAEGTFDGRRWVIHHFWSDREQNFTLQPSSGRILSRGRATLTVRRAEDGAAHVLVRTGRDPVLLAQDMPQDMPFRLFWWFMGEVHRALQEDPPPPSTSDSETSTESPYGSLLDGLDGENFWEQLDE